MDSGPTEGSAANGRSRLRRAGTYLALAVGVLVVLVVGLFVLGIIGIPDAELADNRWGEVDGQEVAVISEVVVDNPNPFSAGADVEYGIDLQGVRIAEGGATGMDIASGESSHNLTSTLFAGNLPEWWSSHLNNGEVSALEADATIDVSAGLLSGSHDTTIEDEIGTDIEGALDESSDEFEGEYRFTGTGLEGPDGTSIEPSVDIENATTEWGNVTDERTEIVTTVAIHNDNAYPIPTPAFAGGIEMNDVPIVEWDAGDVRVRNGSGEPVGEEAFIEPGETERRTFIAEMDNENVSVWFPTHVDDTEPADDPGVEFTEMVVTAQFAFEINGERMTIPPGDQAIACEFGLQTSIFVDQEDGVEPRGCGLTAFEQPTGQLEEAGAVIDLENTDWWDELLGAVPSQSAAADSGARVF